MSQDPFMGVARPGWLAFALAVALPIAASWGSLQLSGPPEVQVALLLGGLAVVLAAACGGFWPAAVATLVAVLSLDYLVFGPGTLFQVGSTAEAWTLAGFAVVVLMLAALLHHGLQRRRRNDHARLAAERAAVQAGRLAQLTAALSRARTVPAVADSAVLEPLQALGADAGALVLLGPDPDTVSIARSAGYEPALDSSQPHPLANPGLMRDAVRRRVPVVVDSRPVRVAEYGVATDLGIPPDHEAGAAVPLLVGGRVGAVLRLDFREARTFTADDHDYFAALAAHVGFALERADGQASDQRARIEAESLRERADEELAHRQSIEQALRASETRYRALASRTTRLHALTAALSEAVTIDAVARAIVQQATMVVGATAGEVLMAADSLSDAGAVPAAGCTPFVPEPGFCETEVIAQRQPLFIASWDEAQQRFWRSASAAADAACVSAAALPLLVDGTAAGVLRFDFSAPVNFDDEYQALLVSVAQHGSQALDRARLYELAQRARAEAEAASRLKDDFLSIVSHELRTPLNAVLGWASMLQKHTLEPPLAERAVHAIQDNATRQARLIDDLLDVSRLAAGRATLDCQDVELGGLVGGVVESLLPVAASSGVDLRLSGLPPAVVTADRRRLDQVFFNLLGNALKFTPSGGFIAIDAIVAGGAVEVRVRDSGVGIEPEFLPFVFDRFSQADSTSTRSYGGLGLGLSIARQLVEAHRGRISVDSAGKGHGTQFTVRLPLAGTLPAREPRAQPLPSSEAAPVRLTGSRILVVDDERDAREVMAVALGRHGAVVTTADSAAAAFEALQARAFDVLLADIAMPEEDGCSLLRRVRTSQDPRIAQIPAAAVTAHARDDERQTVLDAGFDVHLAKPLDPADLVRAVGALLRSSSAAAAAPR